MIKKVNVTFDFDVESEKVSNVKCMVDEVQATTTRKASTRKAKPKEDDEKDPIVRREDNKLVFNTKALAAIEAECGESRVTIEYIVENSKRCPVIGTDISFEKEGAGNKMTKTGTVSYRGKANVILQEYGTEFKLEAYKGGLFKMIPEGGTLPEAKAAPVVVKKTTPKVEKKHPAEETTFDVDLEGVKELARDNADDEEINDFDFSF